MARIRTIKPEFFTSEDICNLTPLSRLFYIALWCEADREGRLDWKPKTFKLRYFPGDNCDINEMAKELTACGLVITYTHDGFDYAEIPTFLEHQVINNRETDSTRPPRVGTRQSGVKAEGKGKEGKGKEGASKITLTSSGIFEGIESNLEVWKQAFPKVDIEDQIRKAGAWCISNPRRAPKSDFARFINSWLSRSSEGLENVDDIFAGAK
jgi:hypothetical protein